MRVVTVEEQVRERIAARLEAEVKARRTEHVGLADWEQCREVVDFVLDELKREVDGTGWVYWPPEVGEGRS